MSRGETRYVPSLGVPALRQAVAERYRLDDGVSFDAMEVAITLGGKQAYALACEAVLDPGDELRVRNLDLFELPFLDARSGPGSFEHPLDDGDGC